MARIPEHEIEQLKQSVSVERLVASRGLELKPHGAHDLIGRCPFHDDRTPSLVVSPKKNLWHCLGACQVGGSVIDWVMKAEGVSFRHAVELMRADAGLSDDLRKGRNGRKVAKVSTVPKLPAPVETSADDAKLLLDVVDYYHQALKESPEALSCLAARGLKSAELIDRFKLGFVNRTLGYRLPAKNRQAGAEIRGRLQSLGILRDSGHEHFNGSVVVPVFDESGAVAEMYGRKISPRLRKGTPLHLYLPGPHRGVWNASCLAASDRVILCESLIDAMTFWVHGFRNVTCSYGVGGFTDEHLATFKQHGITSVLIAYDRDDAGNTAAEKLAERLAGEGIGAYRMQFPKGMDANEYAQKMQPADKALELVARNAVWISGPRPKAMPPAEPSQPTPIANAVEHSTSQDEKPRPVQSEASRASIGNEPPSLAAAKENGASHPVPVSPPPGGVEPAEPEVNMDKRDHEVVFTFGDRRVRVRGLFKNTSYDVLKINLLIGMGEVFHVDNLDLYSARHRAAFIEHASRELRIAPDVVKADLGKVLLKLEALQEQHIQKTLDPEKKSVVLSDKEKAEALELLRDPELLSRVLSDFSRCGVVGEEQNKLVGYLSVVSRKLDRPLAVIVQSSSAAGKSSLMEAVLAFVPAEERIKYSAMTGQSLYYLGETELAHKVLAIVEEEGAERASYALKLLQSEGELTIASTGKDAQTGKLVTHEYHVEGPVMIFLTTTAIEVDEELLNRCLVLTVDETAAQTAAIHVRQRQSRTLAGLLGRSEKAQVLKVHQNAQRLLRPLAVVNPFAEKLSFSARKTRMRRDHMKYLTLIDTIALLHQYQREVKTVEHAGETLEYIEVTRSDILVANRLAQQVLGRTLDELPPQTRRLLEMLDDIVTSACVDGGTDRRDFRFSRRQVRECTGWGNTQLKVHLSRLVEMEYLAVHRGGPGQAYLYELCLGVGGKSGAPRLTGLFEAYNLERDDIGGDHIGGNGIGTTQDRSGQTGDRSARGRGVVGPRPGAGRGAENGAEAAQSVNAAKIDTSASKTAHGPNGVSPSSYKHPTAAAGR